MISRIDIEDMTDAHDEAPWPGQVWIEPGTKGSPAIVWADDAQDTNGAFQRYVRADLARPSQAGDARVARLVEAAREAEFDLSEWLECRGELIKAGFNMDGTEGIRDRLRAALAAMDTPKGGGDE